MPQLNKVRIVNFYYNDGNRLIADELYDFKNTESKKAKNVLINLANGGGKSVLVQLMMQPILPKAKASGRRIESFFTKPSYHSYVLLEWQKDRSPEKLLTGISIRSAVHSDDENDERGRKIQYYTFYSEYLQDYASESITSLELSAKENGNFKAAEYDYIKKLSKNQNNLFYYSQEKSREWKAKLQEFYIYPNEWEMIEKINSIEGGLDMFFSEYTTSDRLVNKLLIPAIENEIRGENSGNNNDNSLATMFMGYADLYLRNAELLKKQEIYRKYISELDPIIPEFERLYNSDDKARNAERKIYGFGDALVIRKSEFEKFLSEINTAIENNNKKLAEIDHEEISAKYYLCKKKYETAKSEKSKSYNNYEGLKQKEKQLSTNIKIQECADYYKKRKKAENEAETIKIRIDSLEKNSDISQEIKNLKYSVHIIAEKDIDFLSVSILETENTLEAQKLKQRKYISEKENLEKSIRKYDNNKSSLNGKLELLKEQTDSLAERNSLGIRRNIVGVYETFEIDSFDKKLNENLFSLEKDKQKTIEITETLKNKINEITNKIVEIKYKQNKYNLNKEKLQSDIEKYESEYSTVCSICDEYHFDYSMIFGNRLKTGLKNMLFEKEAEYINLQNKISIQTGLKNAAEKGSIHVSNEIISLLDTEKIEYITCESYLLTQIENNTLSNHIVLELLEKYPFLAYSLIIENDEYEKICANNEDKWLSSIVPVFSNSEFNSFLEKSALSQKYITGYAVDLFENQDNFISKLNNKISDFSKQLETAILEKEHISEQYELAKLFDYSSDWFLQQTVKLDKIEADIAECNNQITDYCIQQKHLDSEIKYSEQEKENILGRINEYQNKINILKEITENIQKEQELVAEISDLNYKLKTAGQKLNDVEKILDDLNLFISELKTKLSQINDSFEFAQKVYNETSSCSETLIKEGKLEDLFEQYQALSRKQSNEIETLKKSLNYICNTIETYSNEILKKDIDKLSYENTAYNRQFYEKLKNELSEIKTAVTKAENDYYEANNNFIVAEHDFENVSKELEKYGTPVIEKQIHSDFEKRRLNIRQEITQLNQKLKDTEKNINSVSNIMERLKDALDISQRREDAVAVELWEDIKTQFNILLKELKEYKKAFRNSMNNAKENLNTVINKFDKNDYELKNSLINLKNMMNEAKGENIFSLNDMANKYLKSAQKMIVKIDTDLNSINRYKYDLSRQCTMYAEQIYNGLKHIKDSKIKVYKDKSPKNMLKIDIPDNFDFDSAQKFIESEIDSSVEQFVNHEFSNNEQKKKEAEKIVSSGQLLRIAIQKSSLKVQAYKIDVNPANASYRTWEESLKNNSGAEKFIIYFSIILSIMNYSKSESSGINNNSAYSVLILDNPFGSTTSPHILNPMFNLAKHFKVQMICLTHITQNDVIKCFDFVIKAFTKKIAMSSKELLVHEINEETEILNHGFYGVSEQLSLL